jgi:hypothetical protein
MADYVAIAQAVAIIGQVVSGIHDQNKQRQFQQTLLLFSEEQQVALSEKLLRSQTQTARLELLTRVIADFNIQQQKVKDKKQIMLVLVAGSLVAIIITVSLIYALNKKTG